MSSLRTWVTALAVVSTSLVGCGERPTAPAPTSLDGHWRAVLESPGGELPFGLEITDTDGELSGVVHNGAERLPLSALERSDQDLVLDFSWYDSEIRATLEAGDNRMHGEWRKTSAEGESRLPFFAVRDQTHRFSLLPSSQSEDQPMLLADTWSVQFRDESGTQPAVAEFEISESKNGHPPQVTGTFLTPTGDYRFLAGDFDGRLLRLSTFDGAHAFLFEASMNSDGNLEGDFWSRDIYHATWTATPDASATLTDPWSEVTLDRNSNGRFRFEFPDLDGQIVTSEDPQFANAPLIVNIFGSWCPNCNDEAPLLASWYRQYRDRGLKIVGLAYEFSGDPERDREMVRRYSDRHGIEFPLLLAGVSDKNEAAASLPDLDVVRSYPTTIFIGRDGLVRKIHSGFNGPGTGRHYTRLVAELEAAIEEILGESE